ncbi:hypothetical protein KC19_10G102600 [Ceratodon purpureus]|uniref:Major facilitator superfamily (MFS) profile domain-containing protein n=1 Tax=Ceratodon purpureus TaxID=3225 RepID=A0A8T0GK79_CERPU|nr:hypothetical protein KC19_10G102600 [Ceratodon purpureus]
MSSSLYSTGCVKGASSLSLLQTVSSLSTSHGSVARHARPCGRRPGAEVARLRGSLKLATVSSRPRGLSFSSNGIFNPLGLPTTARKGTMSCRSERPSFGQPRASSSELSFQDGYGRRRGRSIERPTPSTSGRSGLPSSNSSRSASLGLFVERTKNAIHWSSKRPRPRASAIEKKLKRSLTGDRQRDATLPAQAPGGLKHKTPVAPVPAWQLSFPHVAVATLTSVLFGYHIGVVNVPLQYIARDLGFAGNTLIQGFVVSVCLVGAFWGCALSGSVADKYGRRRAFQLSSIPMICGSLFSALSLNIPTMLLGRFLVGAGLGLSGPVASLYISEVSPVHMKGTNGSLLQIAGCIGIIASIVAGLPAAHVAGWWRACFALSIIPAVLLAVGMQSCAESPQWLFKQRKLFKAKNAYSRLWGAEHVKAAMVELARGEQEKGGTSWKTLIDPRYIRVVTIGAVLFAFQQFAGINAIFYFSSAVFKSAGLNSEIAASVAVGVVNLIASCLACYLMDKVGRRSLMIYSFTGMVSSGLFTCMSAL